MTFRVLGWTGMVVLTIALAWLWPRIERAPSDFEIAFEYLHRQQPDLALLFFTEAPWRGVAAYRAGRYAQAVREFSTEETVRSQYNLANSHAQLRDWSQAIATYERVLRFDSNHQDAQYNLALIRKLLEPEPESPEADDVPDVPPPEVEEHHVTEPQEGLSERAQAAESPQRDSAGNTNDTDERSDSEAAERPKPVEVTGEVGTATAIGQTEEDQGRHDHRVIGSVDLKPRTSTRSPEVLLRRIRDDPVTVLRARMLSVYESRFAGIPR